MRHALAGAGPAVAVQRAIASRDIDGPARASLSRWMPQACSAATMRRKRAMATAKGLRSTPAIASRARWASTRGFVPGSRWTQRSNRRRKAPSRKCPEPQAGSIRRTCSRPNSSRAGVSVWSRMNSSTNTGLCSRAYFLRVLRQVLVQVTKERVSPPDRKSRPRAPVSGRPRARTPAAAWPHRQKAPEPREACGLRRTAHALPAAHASTETRGGNSRGRYRAGTHGNTPRERPWPGACGRQYRPTSSCRSGHCLRGSARTRRPGPRPPPPASDSRLARPRTPGRCDGPV